MSVINDMLRDLEQRKAPDREAIASVDVTQLIEPQQSSRSIYLILAVLVFGVAIVLGIWVVQKRSNPLSVASITSAIEPVSNKVPDIGAKTVVPAVLPSASSVELTQSPARIIVDEPTTAAKVEPKSMNLAVTSEPTKPLAKPETVNQIRIVPEKTQTEQLESRHQETAREIQSAEMIQHNAEAEPKAKRIVLSPKALDQQNAETALALFKQGNDRKAYRQLFDFIAMQGYDLKSRSVLAGYLLQDGRLAEAGDILVTAPIEQDAELRQIKARWLLASGDQAMAMHTLSSNLPELETHPDYYALLASYYQQFGYPEKAAEVYSLLVQYDANAANWWAGLGLALDSSTRFGDAAQAYQRALQLPGLNRPVLEYINTRMPALKPK